MALSGGIANERVMDRQVATLGFILAGLVAISGLLAWPMSMSGPGVVGLLIVGGAGGALLVTSVARHGGIDAIPTAAVAGIGGSLALTGFLIGIFGYHELLGMREWIVNLGGVLVAGALIWVATALWRGTPAATIFRNGQIVALGAAVGAAGLYLGGMGAAIAVEISLLVGSIPDMYADFALRQIGVGLGFVATALGFMWLTGRGMGYVDLKWPNWDDAKWTVIGLISVLAIAAVFAVILWLVNVPTTEHTLHRRGREHGPELILLAIPFTWIGAVVGEELLFRNGIQKYLTESLAAPAAIAVSSLIFALVHIPAYAPATPLPIAMAVVAIFTISLVLAVSYHTTQNVIVPMIIHGCYNMVVYVAIYLELVGAV